MVSSTRFEAAAAYVSGSQALNTVANDVKLELYALFKCITVSKNPTIPRPSLFDFTGRAKWDAWDKLGRQSDGKDLHHFEERYFEIAKSFGWQDEAHPEGDPGHESEAISSDGMSETGSSGRGGGLGVAVSAIPQPCPDPKDAGTLHAFALSNDDQGLISFLNSHPDYNINLLDDYGYAPLHLAADRGNARVAKVLIEKGADPSIQDPDDYTALGLAEVGGHQDIIDMIRHHPTP